MSSKNIQTAASRAVLNIQTATSRVEQVWEHSQNEELAKAIAELQQAVRLLIR